MWQTTLLVLWLGACDGTHAEAPPAPAPAPTAPPPAPEPAAEPVPADTVTLSPPDSAPQPPPEPGGLRAAGEVCLAAGDCASGICEGEGCTDGAPGVCAPVARGCTRDRRPYCGCGGETFFTSGNCPGQRFAHRGMCAEQ